MSGQISIKCTNCGNPKSQAECWHHTGEYDIYCHRCGYEKSHLLIKEFWKLDNKDQTKDKVLDEKWWESKENTPLGCAEIWYKGGGGNTFSFNSEEEIENFIAVFQKRLKDPDGNIEPGQNTLQEFRDKKFILTNLDTLTTKEYLAEDYFKDVIVITEE